tara:strand:- start:967 stop:1494 length:528 start_codon:yes stop_codon:yes gene_type:complete
VSFENHIDWDEAEELAMIVWNMTDCRVVQGQAMKADFKQIEPGHYRKKDGEINFNLFFDPQKKKCSRKLIIERIDENVESKFGIQYLRGNFRLLNDALLAVQVGMKQSNYIFNKDNDCDLYTKKSFGKCEINFKGINLKAYSVSGDNLNWVIPNATKEESLESSYLMKLILTVDK